MNILVFSAKGGGTGCALRARYIAEAFQKRGHRAVFAKPIPSLPLWLDMALSTFYYFLLSLFHKADAALLIKPYPMAVPALWVQRLKGAKVIIDVDDLDYDYSRGFFKKFHQWLQKPWPAWADFVTYHNPKLMEPIRDFFQVPDSKLVQLDQGVDTDLFKPGEVNANELPHVARNLSEGPIFVFTAHLNVACDLEPVLDAFWQVRRALPLVQLLVAGGGPDEGRFKQYAAQLGISGSVHFTGMVTPAQVAACLRMGDLALVYYRDTPVNQHRASMKLREALATGCKVVSTDTGEAAQFTEIVFLAKPNPKAFSQAVLSALEAKKSPQNRSLLVKKWDWVNCIGNLETAISHR